MPSRTRIFLLPTRLVLGLSLAASLCATVTMAAHAQRGGGGEDGPPFPHPPGREPPPFGLRRGPGGRPMLPPFDKERWRRGGGEWDGKNDKPPTKEEAEAQRLLERMGEAERSVAYIARELTLDDKGRKTDAWIKSDPKRGLRRDFLQPAGDLFVDDRKQLWILSVAKRRFVERESPLSRRPNFLKNTRKGSVLRGFLRRLRVTREGQDTLLGGRIADIVRVAPREGVFAPSRRVWIDRATGLQLKSEEYAPDGRLFFTAYYTSLNLSPKFQPADFAKPVAPSGIALIRERRKRFRDIREAAKAGVAVASPAYTPAGFVLRSVDVSGIGEGNERALLRYSNGLTNISIVQSRQPLPSREHAQLTDGRGIIALPRGQRAYVREERDRQRTYMVIGDLSDAELKKIGDNLRAMRP